MEISENWKENASGHLESVTGKTVTGLPAPSSASDASPKSYADESRGLVLTYSADKSFAASDFAGRDLSRAMVVAVFTASATATLPTDASRVVGSRLRLVRAYSGNLIIAGTIQGYTDGTTSGGGQLWFQGSNHGVIDLVWTGAIWAIASINGYTDARVSAANIYQPNLISFASSDSVYSQFVSPASRLAYSASLANAGTLSCDFAMATNNRLARILFVVRVGDFVFDCVVIAKRDGAGTVTLITPATPKQVMGVGDYASPPTITLAASISGTNVRLTLTNSSGSARVVAMSAVALSEDIS